MHVSPAFYLQEILCWNMNQQVNNTEGFHRLERRYCSGMKNHILRRSPGTSWQLEPEKRLASKLKENRGVKNSAVKVLLVMLLLFVVTPALCYLFLFLCSILFGSSRSCVGFDSATPFLYCRSVRNLWMNIIRQKIGVGATWKVRKI